MGHLSPCELIYSQAPGTVLDAEQTLPLPLPWNLRAQWGRWKVISTQCKMCYERKIWRGMRRDQILRRATGKLSSQERGSRSWGIPFPG